MPEQKAKRMALDIPAQFLPIVDDLKDATFASTRREVLKSALALYHWHLTCNREGRTILAVKKGERCKELVICFPGDE